MKKPSSTQSLIALTLLFSIAFSQSFAQVNSVQSRMNEVFQVTELSHGTPSSTRFYDPWEVTYGPDDSLWITEAKNYRVYKVSPTTGVRRMILDISPGSSYLPAGSQSFNLSFPTGFPTFLGGGYSSSTNSSPQGGLAGLAIHPNFLTGSPYVFVSYIWKYVKTISSNTTVTATATTTTSATTTGTPNGGGVYYQNALVRFTYDFTTGRLGSPLAVCDTLPGSSDHNSQRLIIAPISGTYYLFYANGDMGAGQFGNSARVQNAQNLNSYEGKILRFNIDPDGDAGAYDKWIPSTNPFNIVLGKQSAVWAYGFRNNQGFAYAQINGTDYLYGQMHGPFSDDEINVIHGGGNYGHPLVVGYKKDGNYNNAGVGNPLTNWSGTYTGIVGGAPLIVDEAHNADSMNQFHTYYDPIYTYYPAAAGSSSVGALTNATPVPSQMASMQYMYYWFNKGQQSNTYWPSEAPSGMDVYTKTIIPGWKNSLISGIMKGAPGNTANWRVNTSGGNQGAPAGAATGGTSAAGKLMRLKLNSSGSGLIVSPTNADSTLKAASAYTEDTVSYFVSQNRFRDLAISPDGLTLYAIIDSSQTTSGPTATNPANSLCKGCLMKYTFLGYADASGESTLPTSIDVTDATVNTVDSATQITINSTNNNLWVPITGPDGNIMAEIYPNGNNLGVIRSAFYKNSGAIRVKSGVHYLDRNITISPSATSAVGSPVKIRLYLSKVEYDALDADALSGISAIGNLKILKNNDASSATIASTTSLINPAFSKTQGANGYMLQADNVALNSTGNFSFYFASSNFILPLKLISFTGTLQQNNSVLLKWKTENEVNTSHFVIERSIDGTSFSDIGNVNANGSGSKTFNYSYVDNDANNQQSSILYYRLKMTDIDGAFTYSNVVTIELPDITGVIVSPNPVEHDANVSISTSLSGKLQWSLLDNNGRVIMRNSAHLNKGTNSLIINMDGVSSGSYYLNLSGAGINRNVKIQKL